MQRTAASLLLLPLVLAACGTPLVIAGVGAAVGVWTYDSLNKNQGEMVLHAEPQRVFSTAIAVANAREEAEDIESNRATLRVTWNEGRIEVAVQVLVLPDTPEFSKLKVYAAELKIRGRGELAREIAEQIAARL